MRPTIPKTTSPTWRSPVFRPLSAGAGGRIRKLAHPNSWNARFTLGEGWNNNNDNERTTDDNQAEGDDFLTTSRGTKTTIPSPAISWVQDLKPTRPEIINDLELSAKAGMAASHLSPSGKTAWAATSAVKEEMAALADSDFSGAMSIIELRKLKARITHELENAIKVGLDHSPEAKTMRKRSGALQAVIESKMTMQHAQSSEPVHPNMSLAELDQIATDMKRIIELASSKGAGDAPEAELLKQRGKEVSDLVTAKRQAVRAGALVVDTGASMQQLKAAVNQLRAALQLCKDTGIHETMEANLVRTKLKSIQGMTRRMLAKKAVSLRHELAGPSQPDTNVEIQTPTSSQPQMLSTIQDAREKRAHLIAEVEGEIEGAAVFMAASMARGTAATSDGLHAVAARMQKALNRAASIDITNGAAAVRLKQRLTTVLAMAAAKDEITASMAIEISDKTSVEELRVVVKRMRAASEMAFRSGISTTPEACELVRRLPKLEETAAVKDQLIYAAALSVHPCSDLEQLQAVVGQMDHTLEWADEVGTSNAPEADVLRDQRVKVMDMAAAKEVMVSAARAAFEPAALNVTELQRVEHRMELALAQASEANVDSSPEADALRSQIPKMNDIVKAKQKLEQAVENICIDRDQTAQGLRVQIHRMQSCLAGAKAVGIWQAPEVRFKAFFLL